jgi:hypothetical protein
MGTDVAEEVELAIEVASEVFAEGRYGSNEHVIIVDSADTYAAGLALGRAGGRFSCVTEDGRELSEDDDEDIDIYIPRITFRMFVSPPADPGFTWTARGLFRPRCVSG